MNWFTPFRQLVKKEKKKNCSYFLFFLRGSWCNAAQTPKGRITAMQRCHLLLPHLFVYTLMKRTWDEDCHPRFISPSDASFSRLAQLNWQDCNRVCVLVCVCVCVCPWARLFSICRWTADRILLTPHLAFWVSSRGFYVCAPNSAGMLMGAQCAYLTAYLCSSVFLLFFWRGRVGGGVYVCVWVWLCVYLSDCG